MSERRTQSLHEEIDRILARGRSGPASGHSGPGVPSLERGPEAHRGDEADGLTGAGAEQPGPGLPAGAGGSRGAHVGVAPDEAAPADVSWGGTGRNGPGCNWRSMVAGGGHDGRRSQSADRVADVDRSNAAVARWDSAADGRSGRGPAERRPPSAGPRAGARREREQERQRERQRERERDKDLEWER